MRPHYLASIFIFVFFPAVASAACSESGATVVYINGIFTAESDAGSDLRKLENEYYSRHNDRSVKFIVGYNPSHVDGLGDLLKSIEQSYQKEGSSIEDTDLHTIVLQIYPQVKTQKIVLVGHSQGTFYTNELYAYLVSRGVPASSLVVYNVATPEDYVAGNGGYLTSATDKVIQRVRSLVREAPSLESFAAGPALAITEQRQPRAPLPYNIVLALNLDEQRGDVGGHSFSGVYLSEASDVIISHIQADISQLTSTPTRSEGDCFAPPTEDVVYRTGKAGLSVLDFAADHIMSGISEAGYALAFTKDFAFDVAKTLTANALAAISKVSSDISITAGGVKGLSHAAAPDKQVTDFKIYKALYGSSLSDKDVEELLGTDQGGAAVLVLDQDHPQQQAPEQPTSTGEVLGAATDTAPGDPDPGVFPTVPPIASSTPAPPAIQPADPVAPPPSDRVGQRDMSAASPPVSGGMAIVDNASSTPFVLTPPQHIVFSNWRSPDDAQFCDVASRTFDLSWDPVLGATHYTVTYNDGSEQNLAPPVDDMQPQRQNISINFGLFWNTPIIMHVTAFDASGNSATASASATDAATDKVGPTIDTLVPAWGSKDVPTNTPLKIIYSEAVNPASVSINTIGFSHIFHPEPVDGPSHEPVSINVSLEGDQRTVDITPLSPLAAGERYSLSALCLVKDTYGNHAGSLFSAVDNPQFITATTSGL